MAKMQPEIREGEYFAVDTDCGTEIVPADLVGALKADVEASLLSEHLEGKPDDPQEIVQRKKGWLARMTATPEFTSWTASESHWEALKYLVEYHMDDEFTVLAVPAHFLSALINGDTTGLSDEDELDLADFLRMNPEANRITGNAEESYFDGHQDVTDCICQLEFEDMPRTTTRTETNVEFVTKMMEYSRHGALMQAFIITAIDQYSKKVAAKTPEALDTPFIAGAAWHGCAVEIQEKLKARLL